MKKEVFFLKDPKRVNPSIWVLRFKSGILYMPEFHEMVRLYYFPN
jgi:hypothetical protein